MQLSAKRFPHSWVHGKHSSTIKGRDYQWCLDMEKLWLRTLQYLLFLSRERYTVFHDFSMQGSKVSEQFSKNPQIDWNLGKLKRKKKGSEWKSALLEKSEADCSYFSFPSCRRCWLHFKHIHIKTKTNKHKNSNSKTPPTLWSPTFSCSEVFKCQLTV